MPTADSHSQSSASLSNERRGKEKWWWRRDLLTSKSAGHLASWVSTLSHLIRLGQKNPEEDCRWITEYSVNIQWQPSTGVSLAGKKKLTVPAASLVCCRKRVTFTGAAVTTSKKDYRWLVSAHRPLLLSNNTVKGIQLSLRKMAMPHIPSPLLQCNSSLKHKYKCYIVIHWLTKSKLLLFFNYDNFD